MKFEQYIFFFFHGSKAPSAPRFNHGRGFNIALRHSTFGRTPLDDWSARRRTHNTHNRHPCPLRDLNPQSHQANRPQTRALDCAATETGISTSFTRENYKAWSSYICIVLLFPLTALTGQQSSTRQTEFAAETTDFPIDNFLACKKNLHESFNSLLLRTMTWDEFEFWLQAAWAKLVVSSGWLSTLTMTRRLFITYPTWRVEETDRLLFSTLLHSVHSSGHMAVLKQTHFPHAFLTCIHNWSYCPFTADTPLLLLY